MRENKNDVSNAKYVLIFSLLIVPIVIFSYLFGAYSYHHNMWPIDLILKLNRKPDISPELNGQYDNFGRLIAITGKEQTACPSQRPNTGVLLVIGQSNSANHADTKMITRFPDKVFNYYNGKCFVAGSPLLGATGEEGEFITPLADKLIENGTYKSIVIISSGIGGTPIARWQADGDINEMLLATLANVKYKITDIVWHQGETDFQNRTSAKVYEKSFNSLKNSLRNSGITAPFFIAVATKCGNDPIWDVNNPTAIGQKTLEDSKQIFLAVNTDELLGVADRRLGFCHFSKTGQLKTAAAYADSIQKYHRSR